LLINAKFDKNKYWLKKTPRQFARYRYCLMSTGTGKHCKLKNCVAEPEPRELHQVGILFVASPPVMHA
jgi:hypothetical protein